MHEEGKQLNMPRAAKFKEGGRRRGTPGSDLIDESFNQKTERSKELSRLMLKGKKKRDCPTHESLPTVAHSKGRTGRLPGKRAIVSSGAQPLSVNRNKEKEEQGGWKSAWQEDQKAKPCQRNYMRRWPRQRTTLGDPKSETWQKWGKWQEKAGLSSER